MRAAATAAGRAANTSGLVLQIGLIVALLLRRQRAKPIPPNNPIALPANVDGSGTAFICTIYKGGTWKLQVFGRDGESTGAYVITYDRA